MGGLIKNIEMGLNNKLNIMGGLIKNGLNLDDLIININSENIINTENGDFFNLLLNGYIIEILLNNPLFKNWDDYIKEEVFNLLNGYYK